MVASFALEEHLSLPGRDVNEDCCGCRGAFAWVIDGATGIGATEFLQPTGAAWIAATLSRVIDAEIAADPGLTMDELLERAAAGVASSFDNETSAIPAPALIDMPSACLGLLRIDGDALELACVGDVSLIGPDAAGEIEIFTDKASEALGARTLRSLAAIKRQAPDADPWPRLRPLIRRNRRMMNRPGGYYVVHPRLPWAAHALRATAKVRIGDVWLLATDGLTRLVELFGAYDVAALYATARRAGLRPLMSELRARETADPSGAAFSRVKTHDDATGLLVRVTA